MKTNETNHRTAIKLRHLVEAINNNWDLLGSINKSVRSSLADASEFIAANANTANVERFKRSLAMVNTDMKGVEELLQKAAVAVKSNSPIDPSFNWKTLQDHLDSVTKEFNEMKELPSTGFSQNSAKDWQDIWAVVGADLEAVRGIGASAYLKARMITDLSKEEMDDLTRTIVKHIPSNYSITEADKYAEEYVTAMEQIKEESSKKANLWDRFLNILAGAVPFEQSPAERVMMQRWINGEKGDL
ncbi:MAG: hypothetical protein KBA60_11705 [Flavobacteriales bacterium]|nr:hypothetical protein [Flavobacteriales bacterium]MBP7156669.1 hypothetical protein [Flavobacteriales bacterium]HQV75843.1 hypothetical protein [Flavobacteriales bacterium]HQW41462.1 hypothetical protein [Flavobacteriales bacterium]